MSDSTSLQTIECGVQLFSVFRAMSGKSPVIVMMGLGGGLLIAIIGSPASGTRHTQSPAQSKPSRSGLIGNWG
jgi:hypothetical protein